MIQGGAPLPAKNVGTDAIPPYGVCEIAAADTVTTANGSRVELHIRRVGSQQSPGSYSTDGPQHLWQRSLAFNGPSTIAADNKHGQVQPFNHLYFAGVTVPAWDLESTSETRNHLPVYAMRGKAYLEHLAWNSSGIHPNALLEPVQGIADYLVSEWRVLKVLRDISGQNAKLCIVQPIELREHHGESLAEIEKVKYGKARFKLVERTAYTLTELSTVQLGIPSVTLPVLNYMPDENIDANKKLHIVLMDGAYTIINAEC